MTTLDTVNTNSESLSTRAYRILLDRLIMLDIQPGEPIMEKHLAEEMGVGRTPLREALKRLESDHLVVTYPRRGTFASQVDVTELAHVSEVRQALEPLAARRAAEVNGGEMREQLLEVLDELKSLDPNQSQRDLLSYDLSVHRLIYSVTHNEHLSETLIRLDNIATRIWAALSDRLPSLHSHIVEHTELLKQIVAGDAEAAEQTASEHVKNFYTMVREAL
ncbi:GntR family transcriptional regulator [Enteractinococcus coprophilus]|uniref:DNA-binding GntR family transcriptional regulator n=1 Tax=Enteractinococcus coprophilus TaxID=1027633 RepID=A0A543ALW9_9MICC|nr:GntR family transcriptional regulator [Enteractinococcus coprophilus]TQL73572.1 DNA-binding GntR family transcriptional regulator [Enteractinococcus coprophilus]